MSTTSSAQSAIKNALQTSLYAGFGKLLSFEDHASTLWETAKTAYSGATLSKEHLFSFCKKGASHTFLSAPSKLSSLPYILAAGAAVGLVQELVDSVAKRAFLTNNPFVRRTLSLAASATLVAAGTQFITLPISPQDVMQAAALSYISYPLLFIPLKAFHTAIEILIPSSHPAVPSPADFRALRKEVEELKKSSASPAPAPSIDINELLRSPLFNRALEEKVREKTQSPATPQGVSALSTPGESTPHTPAERSFAAISTAKKNLQEELERLQMELAKIWAAAPPATPLAQKLFVSTGRPSPEATPIAPAKKSTVPPGATPPEIHAEAASKKMAALLVSAEAAVKQPEREARTPDDKGKAEATETAAADAAGADSTSALTGGGSDSALTDGSAGAGAQAVGSSDATPGAAPLSDSPA